MPTYEQYTTTGQRMRLIDEEGEEGIRDLNKKFASFSWKVKKEKKTLMFSFFEASFFHFSSHPLSQYLRVFFFFLDDLLRYSSVFFCFSFFFFFLLL